MHFLFFIVFLSCSNQVKPQVTGCPEDNIDLFGNDLLSWEDSPITRSWEDCSNLCRLFPKCKYWTWLKQSFGDSEKRGACLVKTDDNGRGSKSWAISGSRDCGVTGCESSECVYKKWFYNGAEHTGCTMTDDYETSWCPTESGLDQDTLKFRLYSDGGWKDCRCDTESGLEPISPVSTTSQPSGTLCECVDPNGVESNQCKAKHKCFVRCDSDCSDKKFLTLSKCISSLACEQLLFDVEL
eukprot:GFUD01023383.1.p1 GENE.GFUD01023383.1~~GFUD01023383.1.p1  ORF type:complete len:240 (+),score=46.05 GFUD01023383.1:71-790(+)